MWHDPVSGEYLYSFTYRFLYIWLWPLFRRLMLALSPETATHFLIGIAVPVANSLELAEMCFIRLPMFLATVLAMRLLVLLPGFSLKAK